MTLWNILYSSTTTKGRKQMGKRRKACERHSATDRGWEHYEKSWVSELGNEWYVCSECKQIEDLEVEQRIRIWEQSEEMKAQSEWSRYWKEHYEKIKIDSKRKKEELWDCEVTSILLKGMMHKHLINFPKEFLQLKRASIKLQRLITATKEKRKKHLNLL